MSLILPDVNVSTSGAFSLNTLNTQLSSTSWLEFLNESAYTLMVQIGGLNIQIPAWYDYPIQVQFKNGAVWRPVPGANFPVKITPVLLTNNASNQSSTLKTTLYAPGETPAITTPQPLVRQAYIPNAVTTTVSNSVQSSQQPNGTAFLTGYNGLNTIPSLVGLNNGVLQLGNDGSGPHPDNGFLEINSPVPTSGSPPSGTGTASLIMPFGGSAFAQGGQILKLLILNFTGYQNTNVSKWSLALPVPFTTSFFYFASDNPPVEFLSSGVAQTFNMFSSAGNFTSPTATTKMTFGSGLGAFDTVRFGASDATVHNGLFLVFGI